MCITIVARNNTLTLANEAVTYFNVPMDTICRLTQPKLKRRRTEKRRSVIFNETVTIFFAEVSNECNSIEKTTWYNTQEMKQMKKMAYSKDVIDSPSCRSDHIYKLLDEIGVESYITPAERRRSCRRRVEACRAALKEQLRQSSFDGELDSKRLAESYKELSKEATLESMRLALADEIVARAVMAGLWKMRFEGQRWVLTIGDWQFTA